MKNLFPFKLAFSVLPARLLFILLMAGGLFSANIANAQTINLIINDLEIEVTKDTVAQIKSFTGKHCEGKTYLNWNVAGQHKDGTYVIYRSSDEKNYEVIGLKNGIGVPISKPIAYYFTDESPCDGTATYKVLHLGRNNSFLISDKVNVTINKEYLSNLK